MGIEAFNGTLALVCGIAAGVGVFGLMLYLIVRTAKQKRREFIVN